MKTWLLAFSLFLSSLSLALQLKYARSAPLFDKYLAPARISDYEYRTILADNRMIRDSAVLNKGVGLPYVFGLSEDHRYIICRVDVSEPDLPKSHDEQKKVLEEAGWMAASDVAIAFDIEDPKDAPTFDPVKVEFRSIEEMVQKGAKAENYAEFSGGHLTFH